MKWERNPCNCYDVKL